MIFSNPYYAIFGATCCFLWTLSFFRIGKKPELFLPKQVNTNRVMFHRFLVYLVGITGLLITSYSVMGPRKAKGFESDSIEANDLYLVFDVSRSMLAEDFEPNRLEAAKRIMTNFVEMRPHDRIGLVMFSERVFTQLPLTTDLELIKKMISEIDVGFLGSGTNIGDALGLGVARLNDSIAKNKIMILLTDGVSNVGTLTPVQAAEMAEELKIKVYTIGMGTQGDVKIPLPGTYFGRKRYQTIPGGSIDTESLQKIAKITGGKYYMANSEQALQEVFQEIEGLERSELEVSSRIIYEELYHYYLLLGGIMFLLAEMYRRHVLKEGL